MQKWSVSGQWRMALFALRDIAQGEELTMDYNFSCFNTNASQECRCEATICRGVIGQKGKRAHRNIASYDVTDKLAQTLSEILQIVKESKFVHNGCEQLKHLKAKNMQKIEKKLKNKLYDNLFDFDTDFSGFFKKEKNCVDSRCEKTQKDLRNVYRRLKHSFYDEFVKLFGESMQLMEFCDIVLDEMANAPPHTSGSQINDVTLQSSRVTSPTNQSTVTAQDGLVHGGKPQSLIKSKRNRIDVIEHISAKKQKIQLKNTDILMFGSPPALELNQYQVQPQMILQQPVPAIEDVLEKDQLLDRPQSPQTPQLRNPVYDSKSNLEDGPSSRCTPNNSLGDSQVRKLYFSFINFFNRLPKFS